MSVKNFLHNIQNLLDFIYNKYNLYFNIDNLISQEFFPYFVVSCIILLIYIIVFFIYNKYNTEKTILHTQKTQFHFLENMSHIIIIMLSLITNINQPILSSQIYFLNIILHTSIPVIYFIFFNWFLRYKHLPIYSFVYTLCMYFFRNAVILNKAIFICAIFIFDIIRYYYYDSIIKYIAATLGVLVLCIFITYILQIKDLSLLLILIFIIPIFHIFIHYVLKVFIMKELNIQIFYSIINVFILIIIQQLYINVIYVKIPIYIFYFISVLNIIYYFNTIEFILNKSDNVFIFVTLYIICYYIGLNNIYVNILLLLYGVLYIIYICRTTILRICMFLMYVICSILIHYNVVITSGNIYNFILYLGNINIIYNNRNMNINSLIFNLITFNILFNIISVFDFTKSTNLSYIVLILCTRYLLHNKSYTHLITIESMQYGVIYFAIICICVHSNNLNSILSLLLLLYVYYANQSKLNYKNIILYIRPYITYGLFVCAYNIIQYIKYVGSIYKQNLFYINNMYINIQTCNLIYEMPISNIILFQIPFREHKYENVLLIISSIIFVLMYLIYTFFIFDLILPVYIVILIGVIYESCRSFILHYVINTLFKKYDMIFVILYICNVYLSIFSSIDLYNVLCLISTGHIAYKHMNQNNKYIWLCIFIIILMLSIRYMILLIL